MASISNLGVGSGLDLNSLLTSLTKAESAPLTVILQQQASYNAKLSAYGQLSSALSGLQTAAEALAKATLFQGVAASSTAADVLTASAGPTAVSGSYAVNVTQLAQAQSLATGGVASTTVTIGGGAASTVTLDFGTISGGTLDPATGKYTGATFATDTTRAATPITIDASNNTLAGIRDAINANTAIGVTAAIVNDGSATPNRLVLTSKQSGETSSMRITVTGDAAVSSLLAYNPAATQNLQQTAAAQNTTLTVNGVAITSATNTVKGAIQDVDMTVAKVGASTLKVEQDTKSVESAVTTFVTAYNSLQSIATKLTAFDASSKSGAALTGDSTLRKIQVNIRSALNTAQTDNGSGLTMLSQIGVSFQKDGTLAIDATKLTASLNGKLSGVSNLFSGVGGVGGYGAQMVSLLKGFTDTNGGLLTSATNGMNKSLDALGKQYSDTSERIDATIARYKAQFTKLDMLISGMNQTSSYLTQQFDAMNSSSK
jgi:flagellar hook-associated protein 2